MVVGKHKLRNPNRWWRNTGHTHQWWQNTSYVTVINGGETPVILLNCAETPVMLISDRNLRLQHITLIKWWWGTAVMLWNKP